MRIPFSEKPGRHERHYKRRLDNVLFDQPTQLNDDDLLAAQRLDHEELLAFITELRQVVQRAVGLKPNEESDVVLALKEDLDRLYETSAGLADEQTANQQAIRQLLVVIMRTVQQSAAGDAEAEEKLRMEEQARTAHFAALREPLVADLLHPETLVEADQLAATVLSESAEVAKAVLMLFDKQQRIQLMADAEVLLTARDPQQSLKASWQRLQEIQS